MKIFELKKQIKELEADLDLEYQKWLEPVKAYLKAVNTYVTDFDNVSRITNIEFGPYGVDVTGTSYTWRGHDYCSVTIPVGFFKAPGVYIEEALAVREAKRLATEEATHESELKLLAELKVKYE